MYRPIRWTPGMGGMSAGGVFGVIVLVLLGICCCGYCGAVATGRTKNRHSWMVDAVRDRLPDELPLPSLASLRSRLPTAGRGGYTRRRNDSASGMAAVSCRCTNHIAVWKPREMISYLTALVELPLNPVFPAKTSTAGIVVSINRREMPSRPIYK